MRPTERASALYCHARSSAGESAAPLHSFQILHEHYLVVNFVVNQLVHHGLRHQDAESTWTQPFLQTFVDILQPILGSVRHRRVREVLKPEARTWIGDAIQHHAPETDPG